MKIPILHLQDGIHQHNHTIKTESLNFLRRDIYPEPLQIDAEINKFEKNIQCKVRIRTKAHYSCDRCLTQFNEPADVEFALLFRIGKDTLQTDEEDVVHLSPDTVEVDLTDWITEYLILTIPMKVLCSKDCRGICPGCGVNLNEETCKCPEPPTDPRWEKLREFLK